jgi:hypothetical protein
MFKIKRVNFILQRLDVALRTFSKRYFSYVMIFCCHFLMAYRRRHRVSPDIDGSEYLLLYFSPFEQFAVVVFVVRLVACVKLGTLNGQIKGVEKVTGRGTEE